MHRSRSLMPLLALILSLLGAGAGQAGESSAVSTSDFQLKHAGARDMATVLRTIVGTRQLEMPSERVIRVTDTTEALELSQQLVTALDSPAGSAPGTLTLSSGDSQVSVFRLRHARTADAMKALRKVLQVSRIAVQEEPRLVVIRDTAEKNKTAQALLEILDQACR